MGLEKEGLKRRVYYRRGKTFAGDINADEFLETNDGAYEGVFDGRLRDLGARAFSTIYIG